MWRCINVLALLLLSAARQNGAELNSNICGSMELRSIDDFAKLRNCSLVVGHVRIANIELPRSIKPAQLRSEVLEITDYLMVYRINGLYTLESIFPRLRLIRGMGLLFDQYALTVYENRNLRELGLVELLRVQNGDIRVESNPMLCFVDTINWIYLLGDNVKQHFSLKLNKSPNHCPVCGGLTADYAYHLNGSEHCWNLKAAQLRPTPPRLTGCPSSCGLNGCNNAGVCCDRSCLTGCFNQNCTLCANFHCNGRCKDTCVTRYQLHKREYITYRECRQLGLIPLARGYVCVDQCPPNHQKVRDANGTVNCQLQCKGNYLVKRAVDLLQLQDCITIEGTLTIELTDIKEKIVTALEQALENVTEITGYVKIQRSAHLMSLTFFKSLNTIRGDVLLENKYALYVVDNPHLQQIWPDNRQVAIQRGSIYFHLNPRLCYEKILELEPSLKSVSRISIADVSPNSNGERIICGKSVRNLVARIEDLNATAVRIAVNIMSWEDAETLIGYTYHYMEAPQRNITMYAGRHGCGHDDWLMDISANKNRRHIIAGLRPYTQYAFFVKTLTRTDYHMQIDAYSDINYFRTLPSKPSPVSNLYGSSKLSTQIMLHWWPPVRPNSVIIKYLLTYELVNVTKSESKNYFSLKPANYTDCFCNDLVPYNSGPQPEDEMYYNKEQITYEDALPNLIYVSRRKDHHIKEKFYQVRDYEDLVIQPAVYSNGTVSTTSTTTTTTTTTTTAAPSTLKNVSNIIATDNEGGLNASDLAAAKRYEEYRQNAENKLRLEQDTGIADFLILKPTPLCADAHASVSQQLEQKCIVAEELNGISLPGTQHYYWLNRLQPDQVYKIAVRACAAEVINGCSKPMEILSKTISREVEEFMTGQRKTF